MFERFTDRARRVVVLAQEEARLLNHNYIGTEHILLGLIHEGEGVAARSLQDLGIRLDSVRSQVVETIGQGHQSPSGHIPFTPRAKKVLELSLREALQLGHNYIGTEHILLGLIREGDGVAAQVLEKLGANLPKVRHTVIQLFSGGSGDEPAPAGTAPSGRGSPVSSSAATDAITLKGLRIRAHHGVTDEERAEGQTFVVDVTAHLDLSEAGRSGELSCTVDYGALAEAVHRRVSGERWNLIERVAERVAELVLEDRRVGRVDVTVHKPEAPITVEFEDVAVTVVPAFSVRLTSMAPAVISLGSNMGDRLAILHKAVSRMEELGRLCALSPLYETDPVGGIPQDPFYNAVAAVKTELGAEALVGRLLDIETDLGRVRGPRWGPRIIDLDLILHGGTVIRTASVSVPHPRYRERRFVLEPLVAAWPEARDPDGTRVADLLPGVADQHVRTISGLGWRGDKDH